MNGTKHLRIDANDWLNFMSMFYKAISALILLVIVGSSDQIYAQTILTSSPEKVGFNYSNFEVLGKNGQGIIVWLNGEKEDVIESFYDNMQLHWRKNLALPDEDFLVQKIFLNADTVMLFYTTQQKSVVVLKSILLSATLSALGPGQIVDTLSTTTYSNAPILKFYLRPEKDGVTIAEQSKNISEKKQITFLQLNRHLITQVKQICIVTDFKQGRFIDLVCGWNQTIYVLSGDAQIKNTDNSFPFTAYEIIRFDQAFKSDSLTFTSVQNPLSDSHIVFDKKNNLISVGGLSATEPGNIATQIFYWRMNADSFQTEEKKFISISDSLINKLKESSSTKKTYGFENFVVTQIVPRADGGIILMCEVQTMFSESNNTPGFSNFGISSSPLTITYYHFNEMALFSFNNKGETQWSEVIHKKQQTQNDGGYFSSYSLLVCPDKLHIIYNDMMNGQMNVTDYSIEPVGQNLSSQLFNADHLGLLIAPQLGKQISNNELVIPSYRHNYLQFVKFTF